MERKSSVCMFTEMLYNMGSPIPGCCVYAEPFGMLWRIDGKRTCCIDLRD